MARRKSPGDGLSGEALPPPPAIPEPQKTEAEMARERRQKAELVRLIEELTNDLIQGDLNRAVVLAHMAARRQGPLVGFFTELGRKYRNLADGGPSKKPRLRVIEGEGGRP